MGNSERKLLTLATAAFLLIAVSTAQTADKRFLDSKDAKEKDEPQKFLQDYDKLIKGKDADWVYLPSGGLKKYKTAVVRNFEHSGRGREPKDAATYGKDYMEKWLEKQGFDVLKKEPADLIVHGNVFSAWEPSGAASAWGGWLANPGAGVEVMVMDKGGAVIAQVRHKSKGSTIPDAVENGLEDCAKSIAKGK